YMVELFRYPQSGSPSIVSHEMTDASGQVSMYDPSFSSTPIGAFVHYSIGVSKITKGSIQMVINHNWSVLHNSGGSDVANIVADVSNAETLQVSRQTTTQSSVQSNAISPNTVGDNNCYYYTEFCYVDVAEWGNVWTTIGE